MTKFKAYYMPGAYDTSRCRKDPPRIRRNRPFTLQAQNRSLLELSLYFPTGKTSTMLATTFLWMHHFCSQLRAAMSTRASQELGYSAQRRST